MVIKTKLKINFWEWVLPILSFLIPFGAYVYTLCPTISLAADAGEFATFAYISGFAHPPGYPLFILLIKLFQLLPFGSPAMEANLCAAFFGAAAIPLLYLLLKKLTNNKIAAFLASQIMAFSEIYWRQSLYAEVFSLLAFFIVLTLYLYLLWLRTKNKKYFYGFLIVSGLGLSHQQLLVISLIPLFIYFLFSKKWKLLNFKDYPTSILILLLSFFLPYLYIVFYAAPRLPAMNWENPQNLNNLMRLITRAYYGSFSLTAGGTKYDYVYQGTEVIKMLLNNFTFFGLIPMTVGSFFALHHYRKILLLSIYIFVVMFLFSLFSGMSMAEPSQVPYIERFQIISIVYLSIIIGIGLSLILTGIKSISGFVKYLPLLSLFIIPVVVIVINFSKVNQRGNYFADNLVDDIFLSLPKNSIFIFQGDGIINSIYYHHLVLGKRPDVNYIVGDLLVGQSDWYLTEIKQDYPELLLPEKNDNYKNYLEEFIKLNYKGSNIFIHLPLLEEALTYTIPKVNRGLISQYYDVEKKEAVANVQERVLGLLQKYKNLEYFRDYRETSAEYPGLNLYAGAYIYLAETNDMDLKLAEKYYGKALELMPNNYTAMIELGDDYKRFDEVEPALYYWKKAYPLIWNEDLKRQVKVRIDGVEEINKSLDS